MQPSAWLAHGFLRTNNCKDLFQQKKQTLQDLTQSLNPAAVRCFCKYWKWDIKQASLLSRELWINTCIISRLHYKAKHLQNMPSLSLFVLIVPLLKSWTNNPNYRKGPKRWWWSARLIRKNSELKYTGNVTKYYRLPLATVTNHKLHHIQWIPPLAQSVLKPLKTCLSTK